MTHQSVGVAVQNEKKIFVSPCLCARNGPAMAGWFCTDLSKMRLGGVQNGEVVVPSVSDGGAELLSQSESAIPERFCTPVSKLSKMG